MDVRGTWAKLKVDKRQISGFLFLQNYHEGSCWGWFDLSKDTDLANLVFRRPCPSIRSTTTYKKCKACHATSVSLDQVGSTVKYS